MIWGEDDIRTRVRVGVGAARGDSSSITFAEAERMLEEIDRLRGALQKIQTRAGSNSVVRKIVKETLA
jgi:hypothetical protein